MFVLFVVLTDCKDHCIKTASLMLALFRCCGFQPGYDDTELGYTYEAYRNEWIQNGAEWFREEEKPERWDLDIQLENINVFQ
ncbi:hypothetical protein [Niallia taxi]|uniref:hypothetical protein n=1 Tax=Niallia taxi TaxID=2499688 RepID=UPI001F361510|nr:hypothetical protein [Niallia taxi]